MQPFNRILFFISFVSVGLVFDFSTYSQENYKNITNKLDFTIEEIQMRSITGGTFTMGSNDGEARNNETPHTVTVDDFAIMKYEVTVADFKEFVDATDYQTDSEKGIGGFGSILEGGKNRVYKEGIDWRCGVSGELRPKSEYSHPVIHVSWNDAEAYAKWLSQKTGGTWRLPTETEWEYAAKGGQNFKFSGSDDINDVGWYSKNSGGGTHPVGEKKPNEFGLYDMTGNVWEMCSDWFVQDYYKNSPIHNPQGPASGKGHSLRGGSWTHAAQYCRISLRHHRKHEARNTINGFRLVFIH